MGASHVYLVADLACTRAAGMARSRDSASSRGHDPVRVVAQ